MDRNSPSTYEWLKQLSDEGLTDLRGAGLAGADLVLSVSWTTMSMIGNYLRVPRAEFQRLQQDPTGVGALLYPDDGKGTHAAGTQLEIRITKRFTRSSRKRHARATR